MVTNSRRVYRVGLVFALLLGAVLGLGPAVPAQSFSVSNINFANFPIATSIGSPLSFSATVTLNGSEYVQIQSVSLYIFRADNRAAFQASCALPMVSELETYPEAQTGGGKIVVSSAASNWNYRTGYGWGPGPSSMKYDVIWYSPATWLAGTYQAEIRVVTTGSLSASGVVISPTNATYTFMRTAIFTLSTPAPQGGTNIIPYVNGAGLFNYDVLAASFDTWGKVFIKQGNKIRVRGQAATEIDILRIAVPPPPPPSAVIIDRVYNFGPEGTTFDLPVTISITYDPGQVPLGVDEKNLVMGVWNEAGGEWELLASSVDVPNHLVTAQVDHFSIYGVLVYTRPAAFTISNLTVYPEAIDIGRPVTISANVTNSGDLSGVYSVTLKIDDMLAGTKELTLSGKSSQQVTFNASSGTYGTYPVEINGLEGTFTVKPTPPAPKPPPKPSPVFKTPTPTSPSPVPAPTVQPAPSPSPVPVTTPTPAPAPSPSPKPTASPKPSPSPSPVSGTQAPVPLPGMDWWPIVGILGPAIVFAIGIWLIISSVRHR